MKQTISLRQIACLAGFMIFANKVLVLPSLFYDSVGVDGVLLLILLFTVEILILSIFFRLKKTFKTESFFQILSRFLSKYVAILIYIAIAFYFLIKSVTIYNIALLYLKNQVYFEAGENVFLICFLTISNNLVLRGKRSTARTCEFFYTFTVSLIFFCVVASCTNYIGMPTMFNHSFFDLTKSTFPYLFFFGDTLFLFLIMHKVEYKKESVKKVFIFAIINMILTIALYAVFYSVFRYNGFMHNNAASDVITFSNKYSGVGIIEFVAVVVIMILEYFQLTVYNTSFHECFMSIFPKQGKISSIISFDVLFIFLLNFFLKDYVYSLAFNMSIMPYFALILQYIIPAVVLIFSLFVKRRSNE